MVGLRGHRGEQRVDQIGDRGRGGQRSEQSQHQQRPCADLNPGADVGEDVRVLVAEVGQRLLEAAEAGTAPPAERLLQAVCDQQRAKADAQEHQSEVLGAALARQSHLVVGAAVGFDLGGLHRRRGVPPAGLDVGQWLRLAEQSVGPVVGGGRAGVVARDRGGLEVTAVGR